MAGAVKRQPKAVLLQYSVLKEDEGKIYIYEFVVIVMVDAYREENEDYYFETRNAIEDSGSRDLIFYFGGIRGH